MPDVLILGGGVCGLATAMLLARSGNEVRVLERDAQAPPDSTHDAWSGWERKGVAQFRQPHNLMPRFRHLLEAELPDVQDALRNAGAARFDFIEVLPPALSDREPRPGDDRFWTYTARRPTFEYVMANAAQSEPHVEVVRGTQITELLTGPAAIDGVPHVVGVRTAAGEEQRGDLVIDAMGRRSMLPQWIASLGGRPPYEEAEDCGFTYYTRYFRSKDGSVPQRIGPIFMPVGTFSVLTLPGDNGTWSVTIVTSSGDMPLKRLRYPDVWTRLVAACPLQAHWLDGEPIGDIYAMSGTIDRYRRFIVDGKPVVTGLLAVADAWACTNPSAGRGISVGFGHAVRLRDLVRERLGDPRGLSEEWDAITEAEFAPWYWGQIMVDRARYLEIEALRQGREPVRSDDGQLLDTFFRLMFTDADIFRAGLEVITCITPLAQILTRPGVQARVDPRVGADAGEPLQMPGPTRAELLALVG